jgi:hypothetical protein
MFGLSLLRFTVANLVAAGLVAGKPLSKKGGVFYLAAIGARRPPGCPGETPPKKEQIWRLP